MKVENAFSFSLRSIREKRALKKNVDSSCVFQVDDVDSPCPISLLPLGMTQALVELQESLSQEDNKKQILRKSEKVLGLLSQVQSGLLAGGISLSTLHHLEKMQDLGSHTLQDEGLREILEEIEIRSTVVLTQLEMAAQQNQRS